MSDERQHRLTWICPWHDQGRPERGAGAVVRLVAPLAAVLLAGCSMPDSMNPVDWWHSAEGGRIAEQRPPPPNADAPYPNLSTVPPKPVVTDAATRAKIASGLVADRANAQYAGSIGPDPSSPATAPQDFGVGTAPPPPPPTSSDTLSAKLQAASAPPPPAQPPLPSGPPTPPRPAPVSKVTEAALAAPPAAPVTVAVTATAPAAPPAAPVTVAAAATAPAAPSAAPTPAPAGPPATPAADAAALTIPAAPPPAPRIPGVDVPAITAPTPPPKFAMPVVAAPSAKAVPAVLVPFQPGSVVIAPQTQDALRNLAQRSGAAQIEAIGYGDAPTGDPAAASAALPLALARARAIAAVLTASGVPAALVQVDAEAEGHGGAARITN